MRAALVVSLLLAAVSLAISDGDIVSAIVLYPVVWVISAVFALAFIPRETIVSSHVVKYLLRILE